MPFFCDNWCGHQGYKIVMTFKEQTAKATDPLDKLPPSLKANLDKNLCTCNEVLKIDIINAIVNGATTVLEIKKQTYATMGSGCCVQQVERLIECLCSSEEKN